MSAACRRAEAHVSGSPSASRSLGVARAGGYRPRGHAPATRQEGPRIAAVYLLPYGPGRRPTGGFRLDILSRENGRPSWPPPFGLHPVGRLACATGPEGDTRRLFRRLRWREVERTARSLRARCRSRFIGEPSTRLSRTRPCVGLCRRFTARLITARPHSFARYPEGSPTQSAPTQSLRCVGAGDGALPTIDLTVGKSRRVPASGPVAEARASTGSGPQGAGQDGRPFPRDRMSSRKTPVEARPGP